MLLFIALQLVAAVPRPLSPKDSAAVLARVREADVEYILDWRHEWESWRKDVAEAAQKADRPPLVDTPPTIIGRSNGTCPPRSLQFGALGEVRTDVGEHDALGRFILGRPSASVGAFAATPLYVCLNWMSPFNLTADALGGGLTTDGQVLDEALGIDTPLPSPYRDTVRARRARLLNTLDSAAARLPGDGWIAGQRVRMDVDQHETARALGAATTCRAVAWWCAMLRGYVYVTAHDARSADVTFDTGLARMPADTACKWNDLSDLLTYSARAAYQQLGCRQQADADATIWWLADPLYLVPGNDRRTEHYARRVLAAFHAANDVDEREDMRDSYMGAAIQQMLVRYGWPSVELWTPPAHCAAPRACYFVLPPGPSRFDIHSVYLGLTWPAPPKSPLVDIPMQAHPQYWGPRYHTLPSWSAVLDPLHATTADWELGPERLDSLAWDTSWWPTEFYQRREGPLIDLPTQIGFIRRSSTAAVVAAMEWPTATAFLPAPAHATIGVITSGGPAERPHIVGRQVDSAHLRAILTPIESRPLLLGIEMVPSNDSGAAARARFGVMPPRPLAALAPGQLAISDVMLVRAGPAESFPESIQAALPRMYGSTTLVNPARLAAFWEVYGQSDGDTVDVSFRIVRRNGGGSLARLGAALGIGRVGDDTVIVRWREARSADSLAFVDGASTIRPRGFTLDASALAQGAYAISVQVDRHGVSTSSTPRELTIVRR